jgi:hypothetical protein
MQRRAVSLGKKEGSKTTTTATNSDQNSKCMLQTPSWERSGSGPPGRCTQNKFPTPCWCPKTPKERRYVPHQSPPSVPSFIYAHGRVGARAHGHKRTKICRPEVTNLGIHPTGTYRTMGAKQRGWLRYPAFWVSCCRSGECTKPFAQDDAERTIYRSGKYDVWLQPRRPRNA